MSASAPASVQAAAEHKATLDSSSYTRQELLHNDSTMQTARRMAPMHLSSFYLG
jgi:hypothetical protein